MAPDGEGNDVTNAEGVVSGVEPEARPVDPDVDQDGYTFIVKSSDIQRGALPIYDDAYLDRVYTFDFSEVGLSARVNEAMQVEDARILAVVGQAMKECLIESRLIMPIVGSLRANDDVSAFIRKKIDLAAARLGADGYNLNEVKPGFFVDEYILKNEGFEREYLRSILERAFLVNKHQDAQFQLTRRLAAERAEYRDRVTTLTDTLKEAEESGRTDELTGLPNRKGLEHFLQKLVDAQDQESGSQFAVVWLDGDHFKSVNDRWGHPAGDHVLKEIARILSEQGWDFVGRMGGEEFIAIRKLEGGEDLQELGDRIRTDIGGTKMRFKSMRGLSVTHNQKVSVGVAAGALEQLLDWDLITHADQVSYHSKAMGRDRVTVYEPGVAYKTPAIDMNR